MVDKNYSREDFEQHLNKEHEQTAFSTYLKEIVYGGEDGIVTTFAVVSGFTGAQAAGTILGDGIVAVLLFGFANLFADATSMGLGNFLSVRSEQDLYRREKEKELAEIRKEPEMERLETIHLLEKQGFNQEQAEQMTEIMMQNEKCWTDFMMNYELEISEPDENSVLTSAATFLAFLVFGFIPLAPYVFLGEVSNIFRIAVFSTVLALLVLGILRWRVTKESVMRSLGEVMLLGGTSAVIAYFVGILFA